MRSPALSPEAYDTVDPTVVQRALHLDVEAPKGAGPGVYLVTGGYEPHWVNLYDTHMPRCDCIDHEARQRLCKHLIAVLLLIGDRQLWRKLEQLTEGKLW